MKTAKVAARYLSLAIIAGLMIAIPTQAQTAPASTTNTEKSDDDSTIVMNKFLVTATTTTLATPMDASFAVSIISGKDMLGTDGKGIGGLLSNVPSLYAESAAGEVNQNLSTRGVRGGFYEFMSVQEDGLPSQYNGFFSEFDIRPDLTYDRVEVVRGGPSGVFAPNAAAGIINFVSAVPHAQMATAAVTAEYPGNERLDFLAGGPVPNVNGWYASVGGHYIVGEGSRPVGYLGEWGGQVRVAIEKQFSNGSIMFTYKHIDMHNVNYGPTPAFAVGGSDTKAIPGFDPRKDSMASASLLDTTSYQNFDGPVHLDAQQGEHELMNQFTVKANLNLGEGVSLSETGRLANIDRTDEDFRNEGGNGSIVNASTFLGTALTSMQKLAPTAVSTRLVNLHDNSMISGSNTAALNALNGNGFLTTNDNSSYHTDYHTIANDMRVSWNWADRNSLTVGWMFLYVPADNIVEQGNDFLVDVKNHPNAYNVQGLNAAGAVVANLTDAGVLNYGGDFYSNGSLKTVSNSVYVNDEFNITKQLKVDAGFRREFIDFQLTQEGYNFGAPLPQAAANPTNVAIQNGVGSSGNGSFATTQNSVDDKAFTFGANYRIGEHFAVYARTGTSFDTGVQDFDVFLGSLPKDNNAFARLEFNEVGVRFDSSYLAATVTAFTGKNKNIPIDATAPGSNVPVIVTYDNKSEGVEFEGTWSPINALSIDLSGVIQKATIDGLPGNLSALGLTTSQFNGKQIDRLPDVQVHFQPTFHFNRRGSVYVSVDYVGRRFGDLANTLQLNSYVMFGAGVSYRPLKNLTLSLSGTNLTNKLAFDVGNPRGGSNLSAGTGPIFARALLGTQAKFTATLTF